MSTGLVLEGGGMRGWYTTGVLVALAENKITFPTVYGVSAGALNALTFLSGQCSRKRAETYLNYLVDKRYVSVENLNRTGSIFNFDFLFGEVFHSLLPFDFDAFFNSPTELKTGLTDLRSGRAVFFNKEDLDENLTAVRASCSLPMVSNIVSFQGGLYLDGGCSAPIPVERSLFDGNEKNLIVLTQDATYRKSTKPEFPRAVLNVKYGDYPNFVETMMHRGETYNGELLVCSRLERAGRALILRPGKPVVVSRYEKDLNKLTEIYESGIRDCEARMPEIRSFLGEG
mgnify:CR=1 FL=1